MREVSGQDNSITRTEAEWGKHTEKWGREREANVSLRPEQLETLQGSSPASWESPQPTVARRGSRLSPPLPREHKTRRLVSRGLSLRI